MLIYGLRAVIAGFLVSACQPETESMNMRSSPPEAAESAGQMGGAPMVSKKKKKTPSTETKDPLADFNADIQTLKKAKDLVQTGLFFGLDTMQEKPLHASYEPNFELWTDGAEKHRWVYLPKGEKIDNTDPDNWVFPKGTLLWKEFSKNGQKLETRFMIKTGTGKGLDRWEFMSFAWNQDGTKAGLADEQGVENHLGSGHNIPSKSQCRQCHGSSDSVVLGFSAFQLSHSRADSVTVKRLAESKSLAKTQAGIYQLDDLKFGVVGAIHANCGHCHNEDRNSRGLPYNFKFTGLENGNLLETNFAQNPGFVDVLTRVESRLRGPSMPPIGVSKVDQKLLEGVQTWLDELMP